MNTWWTVFSTEVKTDKVKGFYKYGQKEMTIQITFQGNTQEIQFKFNRDVIETRLYEKAFHRFCGKVLFIKQENQDIVSLSVL